MAVATPETAVADLAPRLIDDDLIEDEGPSESSGRFSPEELARNMTLISNNKHILVYQAVNLRDKVFTTSQIQAKDWDLIYARKRYTSGPQKGKRVFYRKHELIQFPGWTLESFEPFYYCPVPSCRKGYPEFTANDGATGLLRLQGHMEVKHRREYLTTYQKPIQEAIDKVVKTQPNFLTTAPY